jgi:hypothetical protein
MEVHAAAWTAAVEADVGRNDGSALRTANDLAITRHVDVAWAILRDAARPCRRTWLGRGPLRFWGCRSISVVVLVAALAVLPVTHQVASRRDCITEQTVADRRVHPVANPGTPRRCVDRFAARIARLPRDSQPGIGCLILFSQHGTSRTAGWPQRRVRSVQPLLADAADFPS